VSTHFGLREADREKWQRYMRAAMQSPAITGIALSDLSKSFGEHAADVADFAVYLERLRFEADPQPTSFTVDDSVPPAPWGESATSADEADERIATAKDLAGLDEGDA